MIRMSCILLGISVKDVGTCWHFNPLRVKEAHVNILLWPMPENFTSYRGEPEVLNGLNAEITAYMFLTE